MLMPITTTATELQRNYRKVVNKARKAKEAVVVMSNSIPEGVYMDYNTYLNLTLNSKPVDMVKEKQKLLALAGTISAEESKTMIKAMDDMFEKVDLEDWK